MFLVIFASYLHKKLALNISIALDLSCNSHTPSISLRVGRGGLPSPLRDTVRHCSGASSGADAEAHRRWLLPYPPLQLYHGPGPGLAEGESLESPHGWVFCSQPALPEGCSPRLSTSQCLGNGIASNSWTRRPKCFSSLPARHLSQIFFTCSA
jgi:hypothetical protein